MIKLKIESLFFGTLYVVEGDIDLIEEYNITDTESLTKMVEWLIVPHFYEELYEIAKIYLECEDKDISIGITKNGNFILKCKGHYITCVYPP